MAQDKLTADLARREQDRYYGKYRGFVADDKDPEQRGRLRLRVPSVLGDQVTAWALPCLPVGGLAQQGLFVMPQMNSQVWVEFEEGDLQGPIWTGTFWQQKSDLPAGAYGADGAPGTCILRTPGGHGLTLRYEPGKEHVLLEHKSGATVELSTDGSAMVRSSGGESIALDATLGGVTISDRSGNQLAMAMDGIRIKAVQITLDAPMVHVGGLGGEPLVHALSFLPAFLSHMHAPPGAPPGAPPMTGPPVAPPPPTATTVSTFGK